MVFTPTNDLSYNSRMEIQDRIDAILNSIHPDQTPRVIPTRRQKLFHAQVDAELDALLPDGTGKGPANEKEVSRALKHFAQDPLSDLDAKRKGK